MKVPFSQFTIYQRFQMCWFVLIGRLVNFEVEQIVPRYVQVTIKNPLEARDGK